ncbi:unnamed protein product, partial [Musa acuminata subsp. burmannicoides]
GGHAEGVGSHACPLFICNCFPTAESSSKQASSRSSRSLFSCPTEIGLQGSGGRSSCQWPVDLDFWKQSRTPNKELSMEKGLVPLVLWTRRTKVTVNALFIFACFSCAIVLCHSEQIFVACIYFGLSHFKIRGSI